MLHVQTTPGWRRFSLVLTALLAAAVIAVWAKPTGSVSTTATVGAVPVEASAAISPMELMVLRGRYLPATEYVEPF
jgi:hypothetical protein